MIYFYKYPDLLLMNNFIRSTGGFSHKDLIIPNTSLFIGLIGITKQTERREFGFSNWIQELQQFTNHKVIFDVLSNISERDEIKEISIPPEKLYQRPLRPTDNHDRALRRISGMKYFLEHTNYEWFLSATDDIYLDVENIGWMIHDLETQFDPLNDVVFKGHCLYCWRSYYLQGGSGFLFSRRACELFLPNAEQYFRRCYVCDDFASSTIRVMLKLNIKDTCSPYFLGHWGDRKLNPFATGFPSFINNTCPETSMTKNQNDIGFVPFYKLTVIHDSPWEPSQDLIMNMRRARVKDNNLYFYLDSCIPRMCRGKNYTIPYHDKEFIEDYRKDT